MSSIVYVTIGRNVNDTPMSDELWTDFVTETRLNVYVSQSFATHNPSETQVHYGMGEWNGITEESAIVSLYTESGINREILETLLDETKRKFRQDAIAVTYGDSKLV